MWPFRHRPKLEVVDDDTRQPRDEVHSRLDRAEADIEDLYDRLKRLTGRLAKRGERDGGPADGPLSPTPNERLSLRSMRARGIDPFRRS